MVVRLVQGPGQVVWGEPWDTQSGSRWRELEAVSLGAAARRAQARGSSALPWQPGLQAPGAHGWRRSPGRSASRAGAVEDTARHNGILDFFLKKAPKIRQMDRSWQCAPSGLCVRFSRCPACPQHLPERLGARRPVDAGGHPEQVHWPRATARAWLKLIL